MKTGRKTHEPVIEDFYRYLLDTDDGNLSKVHLPHSSVFYAREAYYQKTGYWVTLDKMERCMYLEGMLDKRDVDQPERKRSWEV